MKNLQEKRSYNEKFKNPFEPYIKKIYDIFLKSNNQMSGIKSYNLVVNLLIQDYQSKINSSVADSSWFLSLSISLLKSSTISLYSKMSDFALLKLNNVHFCWSIWWVKSSNRYTQSIGNRLNILLSNIFFWFITWDKNINFINIILNIII